MRAMLSEAPGGPESLVLRDLPDPAPGPGMVRVAIKAAAVNFPDLLIIADLYQFKPQRPFAPGGEAAGVVDAVGAGVTALKPGDRVQITLISGGYADKAIIDPRQAITIPDAMSFEHAAALMLTYATGLHALKDRAGLKAGETLLVLGAAGGTGIAAVELGKAMGARVIAAVSSEAKLAAAKARGADDGLVYPREMDETAQRAFGKALKEKLGENGADVVFDPVGGPYAEPAIRATGWGGRYLVIGFTAGIPRIPLNLALLKGCAIVGVFWGGHMMRETDRHLANVAELFRLHAAGAIAPMISQSLPLERAREALEAVRDRKVEGKIVLVP